MNAAYLFIGIEVLILIVGVYGFIWLLVDLFIRGPKRRRELEKMLDRYDETLDELGRAIEDVRPRK